MLEIAKQVLNMINSNGYKAYMVGGFVRDYLLGIESNDIDITTSATPKQLQEIFQDIDLSSEEYGLVTLMVHKIRFEITTFRKEIQYIDNRKPLEVEYIDDLYQDLQRRDFTINTICMDKNLEIIDPLKGRMDLERRIIKTVGDADAKLEEDSLRILRAIRFSTNLGFCLSNEVELAIKKNKHLLKKLSYNRKKQELDKIFANKNAMQGIQLLLRFHLDKELELERLKDIKNTDSLISVWSILNVIDIYPFNNSEKELITSINQALKLNNLDPKVLYDYGLYVNSVAGVIKGIDKKKITEAYNSLKIHSKKELEITSEEIMELLKKGPGEYLTKIYKDIENKILYGTIDNQKEAIKNYISEEY